MMLEGAGPEIQLMGAVQQNQLMLIMLGSCRGPRNAADAGIVFSRCSRCWAWFFVRWPHNQPMRMMLGLALGVSSRGSPQNQLMLVMYCGKAQQRVSGFRASLENHN